jgi:hypothetical protein
VAIVHPTYSGTEEYKKLMDDYAGAPFEVIERQQVAKIVEEQAFGMTGAIASETAAKAGRILGADHVLLYSVDASDDQQVALVNKHGGYLRAIISARMVNTETGAVTWSFKGSTLLDTRIPFGTNGAAARTNMIQISAQVMGGALLTAFHVPFLGLVPDSGYRGNGARVFIVIPGTIGAKAGIQYGDVITRVEGQMVNSAQDLDLIYAQLLTRSYRDSIAVTFNRGSTSTTLQVNLDPSK